MRDKNGTEYLSKIFGLRGRVAILTGGMGRLGTEYAEALAKAGAKVALFDLTDKPSARLAKLSKKYPIAFFKVDITHEKEVADAVAAVARKWRTPTILINNAGWRASPNETTKGGVVFENYPMEVWDDVFKINTLGAAICAKVVGREMIKNKKRGVIINIASHYALVSPDQRIYDYKKKGGRKKFIKDPSYGASKAALMALTRDLATQWAPFGIRVVAFAPGGVFNPKSDKEFVTRYSARVPLGRMANVNEYNGVLIFLASYASSYITGTTLVADGGWTAW